MTRPRRELELLLLTAFAAVPLYFTGAIGPLPLIGFHLAFAVMAFRVARGLKPEFVPTAAMHAVAIACVPLYLVDAAVNHAIAASTHLVLFIAVYQPFEPSARDNRAQRLLTTSLIFIASLATSTHISVVVFVIAFVFLMFRQLMLLSHLETASSTGREYVEHPSSRAAWFYLFGTTLLAAMLFPVIPRVRNPLVHGLTGALTNATTGLSSSIDFSQDRTSNPDPTVVARVWMGQEAVPFFTPLRLRGTIYDRYVRNEWVQSRVGFREVPQVEGAYRIAQPHGFTRPARVQQRLVSNSPKLFLPEGTFALTGLPAIAEGPTRDAYMTQQTGRDLLNYDVSLAIETAPLGLRSPRLVAYPITPPVAALARGIVRDAAAPREQARRIERYLLANYRYLQRPEQIGRTMSVDDFLLREKRGHCEYFAAGMVALMTAVGVPARIVGGFYGGRLNPLTGYFVIRREDAHAWVEVWEGTRWQTYDPTPASLRPGNTHDGLLRTYLTAISDSVTYFWDRYILTYGLGDQLALAAEMIRRGIDALGFFRQSAAGLARRVTLARVAELALMVATVVGFLLLLRRHRRSLFDDLSSHLSRHGIEVGPATTMEEALARLRTERPDAAAELEPLVALYDAERFSPHQDRKRVAAIRRRLSELRV
jgi:transglutaminase-like putative cysteine protease